MAAAVFAPSLHRLRAGAPSGGDCRTHQTHCCRNSDSGRASGEQVSGTAIDKNTGPPNDAVRTKCHFAGTQAITM